MTWWTWMILGAFLLGAEMFAIDAQFYLVFLGLSAAITGIVSLLGFAMPEWMQWILFATLSLISMFTFRKALYEKIRGNAPGFNQGIAGEFLVIPEDLDGGESTRASFRGSKWTVINESANRIKGGDRVRINRSEGLTLYVSDDTEKITQ